VIAAQTLRRYGSGRCDEQRDQLQLLDTGNQQPDTAALHQRPDAATARPSVTAKR